ncbi:hypothetical protein [Streptomyces sp. MP131-18]|uniref:hypothetical protein n=1 Tax=Streptomyces sp. MP131-18 TaxID=1857892 RepID=UPI0009CA544F|nr:hypothetical protein [Streptomyces sp. MP131-18]ONK13111.1 hypothetical protein STBA_38730 [Streptomyces sp. MP131-18]
MQNDLTNALRKHFGPLINAEEVTNRRGAQVWRVQVINGVTVAVKAAAPDGEGAVLPAREAAVIHAIGETAGRVLGAGRLPDGGSWMATPWWHGPSLWEDFAGVRHNPLLRAARLHSLQAAASAASALASLHQEGWAHGDLQPEHVIRTAERSRLLDLALAHGPGDALPEDVRLPYTGMLVHLEAPEISQQLLDGQPTTPTPQADVYALGGTLWRCWTEMWPVDYEAAGVDPAPGDLLAKREVVASGQARYAIGSFGWDDFGAVLRRALAFQPDARPSARELAEELGELVLKEKRNAW